MKRLEEMYGSGRFEFAVLYGRRRVGKTTLINEFCRGRRAIYFVGIESTWKENLEGLSRAVLEVTLPGAGMVAFSSFEAVLDHVHEQAKSERLILVLDEFPYIAQARPAVSSILQAFIDRKLKDGQLFLILCGSSMSFMERQVLDERSPLYGRRTAQFRILPFPFFEAREMLPGVPPEVQATLYGAAGGVPEYLSRIDVRQSLKENLVRLFFDPAGRLFEEPSNLLKQEMRDPAVYNAIITAIAEGSSRLNEIASKVGIKDSACSDLLTSLMALGLVRKEIPVTEERSRRTLYALDDPMYRFWYRFVHPNLYRIGSGHGAQVYDERVAPQLEAFMGPVFERICLDWMVHRLPPSEAPFFISRIGRWWGSDPRTRREAEIDLVAISGEKALFGECKWTNPFVGEDVLRALKERAALFPQTERHFFVFAKRGFRAGCLRAATADPGVRLVSFESMLR